MNSDISHVSKEMDFITADVATLSSHDGSWTSWGNGISPGGTGELSPGRTQPLPADDSQSPRSPNRFDSGGKGIIGLQGGG